MNLVLRIMRYGIVGTIISVIYSLSVILFVQGCHLPSPTIASVLAFAAIQPVAYFAHQYVTFSDAARDRFQSWRFATTAAVSFTVTTGGMYFLTEILHRPYYFGIALNWMLVPAANFLTYLIWVFRPDQVAGAPAAAALLRAQREVTQIEQ